MDVMTLHRTAVEYVVNLVQHIALDQWNASTPCSDWDVRALVNHLVNEERWTKPLVDGRTIADVGTSLDGDLLGEDPLAAVSAASSEAVASVDERVPHGGIVHVSFGDIPIEEYVMQITADHLVHGWDLAAATGQDRAMDQDLVAAVGLWFAPQEEMWRGAGAIGARLDAGGDPQSDLLAAFGRDPGWTP